MTSLDGEPHCNRTPRHVRGQANQFYLAQKDNAAEFGHIPPSLILGCKPAQTGVDRWDQLYWL